LPVKGVPSMFSLTGSLCGILIKVEDNAAWKDLELSG
jgi:hypothetical protein